MSKFNIFQLLPHNFIKYLIIIYLLTEYVIFAIDIPLSVRNRESVNKIAEPITSGIPFGMGVLTDVNHVRLLSGINEVPAQFKPAAYWPDGSIRWLMVDFQIDMPASGTIDLTLQTDYAHTEYTGIIVTDESGILSVNTGTKLYTFNKNELKIGDNNFEALFQRSIFRAVPADTKWIIEDAGPLKTVICSEGNWYNGSEILGDTLIKYKARFTFFKNKDDIKIQFTFRNNNAFGWDSPAGNSIILNGINFGIQLLNNVGDYVFGQGVEKTWEIIYNPDEIKTVDVRYKSDGIIEDGFNFPSSITAAAPEYYASTGAWGQVTLPLQGFDSDMQADFDLFEKMQNAKVNVDYLEDPVNSRGITIWENLYQNINSWNDYGDLTWGGDAGRFSGNHYDWIYGMLLQFQRTALLNFIDAARVFAKHEIDFDIYHTNADGPAFNYQKNWESRPSHNSSNNDFGGGRPSHTWIQGYILYWLMTGDLRGKDAYNEISEGIRQYIYESFNDSGHVNTSEIRVNGWLVDNLVAMWRVNPDHEFTTSLYGNKSIPEAIKDVLASVFKREAAAGKMGYVIPGDDSPEINLRQPLQNLYFLEPAIKAYLEIFKENDPVYASELLDLIERMTSFLITSTYGGDINDNGEYRPLQIPFIIDTTLTEQIDGQIPYLLMAANAAGFLYKETKDNKYINYARSAFRDYIRYFGVVPGDTYIDNQAQRTPASFNSNIFVESESKIHGWSNRFGQYYLAAESIPAKIDKNNSILLREFKLFQNFPNPFNPVTTISYEFFDRSSNNSLSNVQLKIYDVLGREISVLVNNEQKAGKYEIKFDGSMFSSGVYFYQLRVNEFIETKKMMLLE